MEEQFTLKLTRRQAEFICALLRQAPVPDDRGTRASYSRQMQDHISLEVERQMSEQGL